MKAARKKRQAGKTSKRTGRGGEKGKILVKLSLYICVCRKFVVPLQGKQNGITTIINWKYSILVLTLAALLLSGCKSRAVEEAREVIAVADSLRAEGHIGAFL